MGEKKTTFKEWLEKNERDYLEFPEEGISLQWAWALEDAWDAGYEAGKKTVIISGAEIT